MTAKSCPSLPPSPQRAPRSTRASLPPSLPSGPCPSGASSVIRACPSPLMPKHGTATATATAMPMAVATGHVAASVQGH